MHQRLEFTVALLVIAVCITLALTQVYTLQQEGRRASASYQASAARTQRIALQALCAPSSASSPRPTCLSSSSSLASSGVQP
ncbi:MAG TPA: hypothetical protein VGM81_06280 [Burkholderiaceae bacterium]|jgi:hypothetical protein